MSFILDAIAKSEQERQQLEVPNAQVLAVPAETPPPKKRLLPLLLIIALMLNAILVAVWMQSEKIVETKIETVSVVSPTAQEKIETGVSEELIVEGIDNQQKVEVAKTAEPQQLIVNSKPVISEPVEEEVAEGWVRIEPNSLQDSVRESTASSSATVEPGATDLLIVSRLYDLPESVRDDLPTVKFSGHLYSSDPASSVVFLDNQRPVMQGQQIVDEVFLNEITPDGVVVEFRGYLIQVGVLQNWTLN